MPNAFSKEERVAFDQILEGFQDQLVLSKAVSTYGTNGQLMERASDVIWRPQPYIATSQNRTVGTPVTATDMTQLSVPATLGFKKTVPWNMNALELRDALQEGRLGMAAKDRLASDINRAVMDVATLQGTLVVPITTAAGTYNDVAACDSIMNEQGIAPEDRYLALSSRDYNGMAGNLAVATRSFGNAKSDNAYEKSRVGMVAGFETLKLDYAKRMTATTATVTIATNGAQVRFVPRATSTAGTGEVGNVDNRYQTVTVSTTTGVLPGASFTIAGIEAVHHITKESTGQLKTFRVISIVNGTSMVISPAIVGANSAPTAAEVQYKNVEVVSTSATASITWLNKVAAPMNPFWLKDSIELLPGRYAVPTDQGVDIMRATTDNGIEVIMSKKFDNSTFQSLYTLDTMFGVVNTNPQMNGVLMFGQV
jgi:hypothetical protein